MNKSKQNPGGIKVNKTKNKLMASLLSALMLVTMMSLTALAAPKVVFGDITFVTHQVGNEAPGWKEIIASESNGAAAWVGDGKWGDENGSKWFDIEMVGGGNLQASGNAAVWRIKPKAEILSIPGVYETSVHTMYWLNDRGAGANEWGISKISFRVEGAASIIQTEAEPQPAEAPPQETLAEATAQPIDGQYVVDVRTRLNVRTGAGIFNSRVGTLRKGDVVNVISITDNWAQIAYTDEHPIAYISARYINSLID